MKMLRSLQTQARKLGSSYLACTVNRWKYVGPGRRAAGFADCSHAGEEGGALIEMALTAPALLLLLRA